MRHLLICISILFCLTFANGQEKGKLKKPFEYEKPVRVTLKTNPMAYLVGPIIFTSEFRFAFETKLAQRQSLQIGMSYIGKSIYTSILENNSSITSNNSKLIINGFRMQLTYKWFLTDYWEAPMGFYIAPHFSYSYAHVTTNFNNPYSDYWDATYVNYCMLAGYQLIVNDVFVFEVFSGIGSKSNAWTYTHRDITTDLDINEFVLLRGDVKIVLGVNLGIAF